MFNLHHYSEADGVEDFLDRPEEERRAAQRAALQGVEASDRVVGYNTVEGAGPSGNNTTGVGRRCKLNPGLKPPGAVQADPGLKPPTGFKF